MIILKDGSKIFYCSDFLNNKIIIKVFKNDNIKRRITL